jgi:imidazolonepropionase-like amidohydrolase
MRGFRLVGLLAALAAVAAPARAEVLAITGATLIDGTGRAPVADSAVVIDGARIVAAGRRGAIAVPAGATRLDAAGKWLIPGLIDSHVHLFMSGGLYTSPRDLDLRAIRDWESEELPSIRAAMAATLARYLASGVTAVIDRGGPMWTLDLRDLAKTLAAAPRLALSGPLLTTYPPRLKLGADPASRRIATPEQARAMVRELAAAGVDLVKIHFIPLPGADLEAELAWVRAAVAEAHARGLPVTAHATRLDLARAVVEAGVDQLVHSVDDRVADEGFVRLLGERGTIYTTTLLVFEGYREVFLRGLDFSAIERRLGDAEVIASLDDLAHLPRRHLPPWLAQRGPGRDGRRREPITMPYWAVRPVRRTQDQNLRLLASAGITVAAGTDAGTIGNLHGPALHRELELMAGAGLSPLAVLRAATLGGARAMGRAHELGTVEPGKLADLVVLDADPLADIRNTRHIWRVIKGGQVFDPAELAREIGAAPR